MTETTQRGEIKSRLNRIFHEVFDDDEIEIFDEMTANDIEEWDSLMHIGLIVAVEEEFEIRMSTAEIGELQNGVKTIQKTIATKFILSSTVFLHTSWCWLLARAVFGAPLGNRSLWFDSDCRALILMILPLAMIV